MTKQRLFARASLALTLLLLFDREGRAEARRARSSATHDAVEVEVHELPPEDSWQVTWKLPSKAAGVEFPLGRGAYRRAGWTLTPGAQWVEAAGVERLCFAQPSRELAASFRSDLARRPKDYEVQVAMSDGARLFYTGQVLVRPLDTCAAGVAPAPDAAATATGTHESPRPAHRFRFSTASGRTVRAGELAAAASLDWKPPIGGEETYAYFGPQPAVEVAPNERMALVADPALPPHLRQGLEATVAKLFDHFAGETGLLLPHRPLVLLSFDPRGSGRSFDGGVLGPVVQLAASGEGWARDDAATREAWTVRLAHELFHLWGGALLHSDAESEWLSEAAAEAFALRAAYGLGVLDAQQVAARLVDLGNRCIAGLDGQSLLSAPQRRAWDTWYSCGPVLLFVAGQAVERKQPDKGGLGLLVREMFAEGMGAGGVYGTGTFLGWLDKLSGDRTTVFAIQGIIRRGVPRGADRVLAQLLTGAGYRVALAEPSAAGATPEVFGLLLRRGLARCACGAGGEAATEDGDCARLSGEVAIAAVDDVDAPRDPAAAYARLRNAAGLSRPIRISTADGAAPLTLFCGRETFDPSFEKLLRLE